MDLAKFDSRSRSEQGVDMVVRNPGNGIPFRGEDGKPVTITLYGRNSATYRAAEREVRERQLVRTKNGVEATPDEIHEDLVEFLCAMTKSWSNLQKGDQEFPATPENIRQFWSDTRWAWLARQAEQFAMNEANFLQA